MTHPSGSILADFVDKITDLSETKTFEIAGQHYSDKTLVRIPPYVDRPSRIEVNSLDSICKLIRTEREKVGTTVMVRIKDARNVEVYTTYLDDFSRNSLYAAKADVPDIRTGFREHEQALIELRSLFMPNEGVTYLLDLLSRMSKENSVTSKDNGVTQSVEAKKGVSLLEYMEIRPRVFLQPFRTFLEVPQPESEFLLRVGEEGEIGLFEADGGVWQLEAKRNIADYFAKELCDLIDTGAVVVMQ